MTDSTKQTRKSIRQLLVIAALVIIGFTCVKTLRFTIVPLNFLFVCAFFAIPFVAVRPVLRLPNRPKWMGLILLSPLLLLSSCFFVFDGLLGGFEQTQPLQTFQSGGSIIQLERYENGGAVGVHAILLEQRRPIIPGLYLVRSVASFEYAHEGTLFVEGPDKVRVYVRGNYYSNDYEISRVFTLKPWVYF